MFAQLEYIVYIVYIFLACLTSGVCMIQQTLVIAFEVQPRLATVHTKFFAHVLGLLNHAMGEHR